MATREEVTTTLGVDASTMEQGLGIGRSYMAKYVQNVKEQETGYTGWWNQELKRREDMEVKSAVEAASRSIKARRLLREREALREAAEAKAQQVANEEISKGSGGSGWRAAEGTAAAAAAAAAAKKAAEGMKEVGESAHFGAGALREAMVLVREGLRGNFRAMIGSGSRLISLLGVGASTIAGLAAVAAPAALIIWQALRTRTAVKGYDASLTKETEVTGELAAHLREDIGNMVLAHRMSKEVADKYMAILANPTLNRVTEIAKLIKPAGYISGKDANEIVRLEAENQRKIMEYARENESFENRHASDTARVIGLQRDLKELKRGTVEYAQKQLALTEAQHNLDQDDKKLAEDKLEVQQRINDEQKIYSQTQLRISEMQQHEREKFMPTLDELTKFGGIGGSTARRIAREERRIKREFAHGDVAGANRDIADRNKLYDSLASRGIVAERSELRELKNINAEAALHLKAIREGTAVLKARIAMG